MPEIKTDICVIGAGSGGLSVAAGAVQMGADTVLIEGGKMGGDCLNYGCVPSKSLIAAARAAHMVRSSGKFGVNGHEPDVDFARVNDHVQSVIKAIEPHDSVERFEGLGVKVLQDYGRFTGPKTVVAGDTTVTARRFVIATGSRAVVPPIPGLADVPYLTNETVFGLRHCPDRLIIVGGGPIGLEMAQAHRRLGAQVTVLERATLLPKDDAEMAAIIRHHLLEEGIDLREGADIARVERNGNGIDVVLNDGTGGEEVLHGSDILIAAGRAPVVDTLNLDAAGVATTRSGITVDTRLRTTNKKIFAIGDVSGGPQFTHVAGYHAGIIIKNALFRIPAKADYAALPWVTYTDPELAHVGQTEEAARQAHSDIRVLRWSFNENDRAQAERETDGLVKAIVTPRGKILGATIVGPHAGELIQVWGLAISQSLKIGAVAQMIAPYPTLGEVNKRAAGSFYTPSLFSDRTKKVVRFLSRLG